MTLVADPSSSRLSKQSFYVALALLAFAQTHHELSIEAVSASRDALPIPTLPSTLSATSSSMTNETRPARSTSDASLDPWNTGPRISPGLAEGYGVNSNLGFSILEDDSPASGFGEDLPANGFSYGAEGWALGRQDKVEVTKREELGGWLLKHDVYFGELSGYGCRVGEELMPESTQCGARRRGVTSSGDTAISSSCPARSCGGTPLGCSPASRRSEWLSRATISEPTTSSSNAGDVDSHDSSPSASTTLPSSEMDSCIRSSPNKPFVSLPASFLPSSLTPESQDLALWRKDRPISLDEESTSRTLTPGEEMLVPEDIGSKLSSLRSRITLLVEHWTKICSTYDRIAHRRENQGTDWTRLRGGMEAALETERSGWRVAEVEGVESEEVAWAQGVGRAGEIEGSSAGRTLDSTVEELKRVSRAAR